MNNLWQSFRSFRSFQTVRSDQVNAIHIWWLSPKNRTWDDLRWLEGMSNFGTNDSSICKHPVLCMTRIFPVKQRMIRRYKQCLLANMSFTRASWYSMILWWLMISTHLHGFLIIVADECRWYVRLQEQLLQRVCSCCKQGRMAQIYTKYHRTTETEQKTSTCINLPHSQLLDESGKPLVLRLLWQCIENWIAVIYRATWIWPWSWSITLSLKPNSCDDFQCEARNYKYSYMFSMTHHDTTTDSPRTVSETFGDQSTTEFQIVEATASFSERERERLCGPSPKRHVGLHQIISNTCGTWHADCTCGIFISSTTGQHLYRKVQESVMPIQGQTGRLSHAGWKHASPPQRESLCCV